MKWSEIVIAIFGWLDGLILYSFVYNQFKKKKMKPKLFVTNHGGKVHNGKYLDGKRIKREINRFINKFKNSLYWKFI